MLKLILNKQGNQKLFYSLQKRCVSNNRHNSYFDIHLDWLKGFFISKRLSFSRCLFVVNVGIFIYSNLRLSSSNKWLTIHNLAYSYEALKRREYTNLVTSQMGSARVDDFILESSVLLGIGHKLELLYGSPLIIKLFLFSLYIGFLSSMFFVTSNHSKKSRFHYEDPLNRNSFAKQANEYNYLSQHGLAMSFVYFYLFKNFKLLILPVLGADLYFWGPYYSNGPLTGLAAGILL